MNNLIERIKEEGKKEVDLINHQFDEEARQIMNEARQSAEKEKAKILEESQRKAEMEKTRIISSANISVNRKKLTAVDELTEKVFINAKEQIPSLRKNKNYGKKLEEMVKKGVIEINEKELIIRVAKPDVSKIKSSWFKGIKAKVNSDDSILAGAVIESGDGLISVDYTFESLLEKNWPHLKKKVVEELMQ
ncbi:MAG: V-type ATP synthase subunit E family protein [Candidatus Diapherotrites archaeon]